MNALFNIVSNGHMVHVRVRSTFPLVDINGLSSSLHLDGGEKSENTLYAACSRKALISLDLYLYLALYVRIPTPACVRACVRAFVRAAPSTEQRGDESNNFVVHVQTSSPRIQR